MRLDALKVVENTMSLLLLLAHFQHLCNHKQLALMS